MLSQTPLMPKGVKSKFWFLYIAFPLLGLIAIILAFYWWRSLDDTPEAWLNRGNDYYESREFGDALEAYQTSNQKAAGNPEALTGIGRCYLKLNKVDFAMKFITEAIRLNPKLVLAYIALADAEHAAGDNQAAISAILQASTLDPSNPEIYLKAGDLYSYVSEFENALAMYHKVLELAPNHAEAKLGIDKATTLGQRQATLEQNRSQLNNGYESEAISTTPDYNPSPYSGSDSPPEPINSGE